MAANPVLDYARPDVEALVWSVLAALKGITSWAYAAHEVPTPAGWLVVTSVQVNVKDRNKQASWAKADQARRLCMGLPGSSWPEGVVNRVDTTEGPFWSPDVDGAPRYVVRFDIYAHPRPQSDPATRSRKALA